MKTGSIEEGISTFKNFKIKVALKKKSGALKTKYPILTSEEVKFESDKETYLFI